MLANTLFEVYSLAAIIASTLFALKNIYPVHALKENLGMLKQDKNKQIIVYCRVGNRSIAASRILEQNGFTPLNVKGGIIALKQAGANLVK